LGPDQVLLRATTGRGEPQSQPKSPGAASPAGRTSRPAAAVFTVDRRVLRT